MREKSLIYLRLDERFSCRLDANIFSRVDERNYKQIIKQLSRHRIIRNPDSCRYFFNRPYLQQIIYNFICIGVG